jgi:hypothetical protein
MFMRVHVIKVLSAIFGAGVALGALAAEPPASAQRTAPTKQEEKPAAKAQSPKTDADPAVQQTTRADRLDLDTTVVTGNRELPKVLYIVPWKKADIGELPSQPFNTLLDEVLTPVDRDVFRREVTYYEAVSGAGNDAAAPAAGPTARPEK